MADGGRRLLSSSVEKGGVVAVHYNAGYPPAVGGVAATESLGGSVDTAPI